MGKNKSKKSKKAKNREPRKPIQIKKSTLRIIILSAILVAAVTAALIVRHVIKKRIADRTVNIAFYGLDEKLQDIIKNQIPQEENIILNFDVISDSDFDSALIKDKYDMLFTWRGEVTDSLSKVAEEIPSRILEVMPSSLSRSVRDNKCVPILLDHCELTFNEAVMKKLGSDVPLSFTAFTQFLKDAKGVVFSPFFCNGAEDRILIDFVGALVLADGGLSAYNRFIEELRKTEKLEDLLDFNCDEKGRGSTLRSILDMLNAWPKEGYTHPAWFNGRGNDLVYFAEDNQLGSFFTLLSEHRKIPYNVISKFDSSLFPPDQSANNYGLIAPAVSGMLLSDNANCKRYLAGFFTEDAQMELSNLSTLAPVHSRAQAYDRQADDVRFWAASCYGGALPDLYYAVYQRKPEELKNICSEIRLYVR